MGHIQIIIHVPIDEARDILIAQMNDAGYNGFEENDEQLIAYIPSGDYNVGELNEIVTGLGLSYTSNNIAEQNWNKVWEENFQPVTVGDFCTVRADFHEVNKATKYEVVINPKMSFGTGHHATTQLVIQEMEGLDFANKEVLDFGTGTGILAILAEKLGAKNIQAIDYDEWCYTNAVENTERNNCERVIVQKGSLELVLDKKFDIILANINRHILLEYMNGMSEIINASGQIIMSGILTTDKDIILEAAHSVKLKCIGDNELNNWMALHFVKE